MLQIWIRLDPDIFFCFSGSEANHFGQCCRSETAFEGFDGSGIKKANDDIKKYNTGDIPDSRSLSTRIMELNDYNGVNVSGIKELDNTTYGSVIYNLDNISRDFQPVGKNEVGSYCTMQKDLIVNKQEYLDTPEQNIMRLITSEKHLNPITIQKISSKYITFFFNRYLYFLSNVDLSFLPEYYRNVY